MRSVVWPKDSTTTAPVPGRRRAMTYRLKIGLVMDTACIGVTPLA